MSFGIDTSRVYGNDGTANPAFWTVFPGHVHGEVVKVLLADTAVQVAIQAKLNAPGDAGKRGIVVDLLNRATANCIGQHIVGQTLQPDQATFTLYNLLGEGTAGAVDAVLGDPSNQAVHQAFADKKAVEIITLLSRQTGRALFQTCLFQLTELAVTPQTLLFKLKDELLKRAAGIVPGIVS